MTNRRLFLMSAPAGLATAFVARNTALADDKKKDEEEVGAAEDLMREHGVLNRVLLIYEEGLRRIHKNEDIPPDVFRTTATLVRKFVEDYHEQLEEKHIFPAFEKAQKLTDLVKVLRRQHEEGRDLT
ncbi:MAG TPA: hemerythrin domain-containing protein, partial [Gemmata sp.]|nr:hemerythrin domain-containing protein [Gemmata sp.]